MVKKFRPIFIVGSSWSGTTMMNRILGNHKEVSALNELHFIGAVWNIFEPLQELTTKQAECAAAKLIMHIRRGFWDGGVSKTEARAAKEIILKKSCWTYRDVYQVVLQEEGNDYSLFVTDQTPRNVYFVDKILENFPHARIIHMVRDPRAVLFSQRNRWKKRWLGSSEIPLKNALRVFFNYHPYTLSKLWKKTALIAEKFRNHEQFKVVVFESLVSSPDLEIQNICDFIGIEFHRHMIDVPQVGSSNKRYDLQKIGISSDVIDMWRNKLPKGDVYICEKILANQLKIFGYEMASRKAWKYNAISSVARFPLHVLGSLLFNPKVIYIQIRALVNLK